MLLATMLVGYFHDSRRTVNMADKKLVDGDIENLINLWHNEPALWDSSQLVYSNTDARRAALIRISKEMQDLETSMYSCYLQ